MIKCAWCGILFQREKGSRKTLCPECTAKKLEERMATCAACGRRFEKSTWNQKYCEVCRKAVKNVPGKNRQQRIERLRRDAERARMKTIPSVVQAAQDAGMSYGQYVAMVERGD